MGAWGHDHFDNDTAQDLICDIRTAVESKLRKIICAKRFTHYDYWAVIAASALIAEQGETCGESFPPLTSTPYRFFDLVAPAIEKLSKILEDQSFFDEWSSPSAKKHAVESLYHRLLYMKEERDSRYKTKSYKRTRHKRKRVTKKGAKKNVGGQK